MAGKSHNYTMNLSIKAQADGIGKTNSEITQLNNEVKRLDGKKIDLKISLGSKLGKEIDSLVKSIGNIEKSLNSISSKGLQGLEQAIGSVGKSTDATASAIGSLQKSVDGISAKGIQGLEQAESSATKGAEDLASAMGHVQTASDSISGKGLESLQMNISKTEDAVADLASQMEKIGTTSGFGDNWNNSYGGRYGGMRYTGQGKGISDLVSFIGNGKNSYELTVENAMNKNRNMGIASSWTPANGRTGMDAYWKLDEATDNSLMSLNTLAAGVNAAAATMGLDASQIEKYGDKFADFGTMVMGLGYTEDVAQTAVMKLGRGLGGQFTALDQYGITMESLKKTGKWNGDESDVDGYMDAVAEYSSKVSNQLMKTQTGQVATLSKSASLGGYALGAMEAEWTAWLATWFRDTDSSMRTWTKDMGWGAKVRDNFGRQIYEKGHYETDTETGKKKFVVDDRKNSEELESMGISNPLESGWREKTTGFSLSTLIIGADQVISTYKTIKDTILGTYAEWRDLKRMRQIGLRNIFKGDDYDLIDNHIVKKAQNAKNDMCNTMNDDCPANGSGTGKNKSKKKKSRFGRWKDSIGNKMDSMMNTITGRNPNKGKSRKTKAQKRKRSLNNDYGNKYTNKTGDYNLSNIGGALDSLFPEPKKPKSTPHIEDTVPKMKGGKTISESEGIKKGNRRTGDKKVGARQPELLSLDEKVRRGTTRHEKPSYDVNLPSLGNRSDLPSLNTGHVSEKKGTMNYPKGTKTRNSQILNKTNLQNQFKEALDNITPTSNVAERERKREEKRKRSKEYRKNQHKNKYGGYMSNVLGAGFELNELKSKAKGYLKTKKKLLKDEYSKGLFRSEKWGKSFGDFGRKLPGNMWNATKSGAKGIYGAIPFSDQTRSTLGNTYSSLQRQGSYLKNGIKGTRTWGALSRVGTDIKGNASALGQMTGFTPWFNNTRVGKGVQNVKQQGIKSTAGKGASKMWGGMKSIGGSALSGASKGIGAMASGLGKVSGLVSGIGMGFLGILGPIGAIIGGITLITGILDALGVDLSPLQEAFGGMFEALKPVISGLNEWIAGFAKDIGPILTQVGQALAPILQALGGLISGGLSALGGILGPILSGIGSLFSGVDGSVFDGLSEGLDGLGKTAQKLWDALGEGSKGVSEFLGGVFDGIGQYISHAFEEGAKTISNWIGIVADGITDGIKSIYDGITKGITDVFSAISKGISDVGLSASSAITMIGTAYSTQITGIFNAISTGIMSVGTSISTIITMIGTAYTTQITSIFNSFSTGIMSVGTSISTVITMIGTAISTGISGIYTSISSGILLVGTSIATIVTGIFGAVIGGISGLGSSIAGAISIIGTTVIMIITGLATAISMGITSIAMAITQGLLMVTNGIIQSFSTFATTVATTTAQAYATLLTFQGNAVSLMGTTATDMVNAFVNNFTGIQAGIDSEMSGAYDTLCTWGDKMVAKAEEIGRRVKQALLNIGMGVNSPGYIWRGMIGEMKGTYGALASGGHRLIQRALAVGRGITQSYVSSYNSDVLKREPELPINRNTPLNKPFDINVAPVPVTPPQFTEPKMFKEMKKQNNTEPITNVYNFNHHGYIGSEELGKTAMDYFAEKINFENKKANRSV